MTASPPTIGLVTIGNAIVDILAPCTEDFISAQVAHGMQRGAMNLINAERAIALYDTMGESTQASGGSAGNTIAAYASFGGNGAYIGKVGNDYLGQVFAHDMKAIGVQYKTVPAMSGTQTARSMILITPDGERTMNTFLGACVELSPDDIDEETIKSAAVTYMEGYLFDPPLAMEAFYKAAKIAHAAGRKVSLTLSDSFCVNRHRAAFQDLVENHIDILFANEEEIKSLYETGTFEEALNIAKDKCGICVLTRSEKGSVIVKGDTVTEVKAEPVEKVIDTTGAGDAYAAGFLYGYTEGLGMSECGRLGSIAAAEVISHIGPRPHVKLSELIPCKAMKEQDAPLPPESAPHAHYMRPLDGLRGLACFLVVASHIAVILNLNFKEDLYNIGSMGVVIFFALSGFLMSMLYSDKEFSVDAAAKYAIARMARIAPAYWIALLFVWVLYLLLPDGYHYEMTPFDMLRSVFFMGNVGVFWSIPPEIQFYGFFLLLWFAYDKLKIGNYSWAAGAAVLCLAFIGSRDFWGGLMLPSKLHIFFSGFLVAFLVKSGAIRRYLCHPVMQAALVAATILYAVYFLEPHKIYDDLIITALVALSVGSLSRSTLFSTPLETQTMRLMGAASFSIYLLHDAILQAMKTLGLFNPAYETFNILVMCIISIAIPVVFHVMVEKRLTVLMRAKIMLAFERMRVYWPLNRFAPAGS